MFGGVIGSVLLFGGWDDSDPFCLRWFIGIWFFWGEIRSVVGWGTGIAVVAGRSQEFALFLVDRDLFYFGGSYGIRPVV